MLNESDGATLDYDKLRKVIKAAPAGQTRYQAIVNAPFEFKVETTFLFLGIIVLLLANKETGTIDRIALSNTELAKNTTDISYVPFSDIKIPLDYSENIISQTIRTNRPHDTTDWKFLFDPALTPEQARLNQASGGIAYSAVYPLEIPEGGAMIFSYFQYEGEIGHAQPDFMKRYSQLVSDLLASTKSNDE